MEISHHERRWVSLPLDGRTGDHELGSGPLGHHRHREHRPRGSSCPRCARRAGSPPRWPAGTWPGREAVRAGSTASSRAVAGYQALIDDPDVDALYIALPNSLHARVDDQRAARRASRCCARSRCAARSPTPSGCWRWRKRDRHPALGGVRLPVPRAQCAAVRTLLDGRRDRRAARDPVRTSTSWSAESRQHQAVGRPGGRRAARRRLLPGQAGAGVLRRARQRVGGRESGAATASTSTPGAAWATPAAGGCCCRAGCAAAYDTFSRLLGHRRADPADQPVPPRPRRQLHGAGRRGAAHLDAGAAEPSFTRRSGTSTPCCAAARRPACSRWTRRWPPPGPCTTCTSRWAPPARPAPPAAAPGRPGAGQPGTVAAPPAAPSRKAWAAASTATMSRPRTRSARSAASGDGPRSADTICA